MTDLRRSYLVQRLRPPYKGEKTLLSGMDNVFSFGGGYKNGGLSDEAMNLLRECFRFDYMGSAEYEFGAVPKAFNVIAKQAHAGDLTTHYFVIKTADVAASWHDKTRAPIDSETTIYMLCHRSWRDEVEARVREMAAEGYHYRAKEAVHLDRTLRPHAYFDGETQGWLELDNGYMFFTSREMAAKVADLFGQELDPAIPDCPPPAPPTQEAWEAARAKEQRARAKARREARPQEKAKPPMCGWQKDSGAPCLNRSKAEGATPSALKASKVRLCGVHANMAVRRGWKVKDD